MYIYIIMAVKTDNLKISIAQRVLSLDNDTILEQINIILNKQNIIGFNSKGEPISEKEYILEMDEIISEINEQKGTFYTSEEIKKRILDENNLA